MNSPNYYAIIPASVRYDNRLSSSEKLLYGEITALSSKEGFCWATNQYFASLYNVHKNTVSGWVSNLENCGHISTKQDKNEQRKIYIVNTPSLKRVRGVNQNIEGGINENTYQNNTSINNKTNLGATRQEEPFISVVKVDQETEIVPKRPAKYPNARIVFGWFPKPQKSWEINTTELKHAGLLYERGEAQVKRALEFIEEHKENEYLPRVTKPSDLERKWEDLLEFKKKHD